MVLLGQYILVWLSIMFNEPSKATAKHKMNQTQNKYELVIIGGGIAGSMLGAAMARNGVKTLILERGVHPKFSIGESMILETSEIMRSLAYSFDVPELEYFSAENFMPLIGGSHGVKRHFSYMPHQEGQTPDPDDLIQAIIPKDPYGHELHIYRQDSDYFYISTAIKYGATVCQNQNVSDVEFNDDGVKITIDDGKIYHSDYVVDAGGHNSLIANQFDLRHNNLKTNTRGLFTHMRGVPSVHDHYGSVKELGLPFSFAEGTLHHVFHGGWLWIIPFNNHLEANNDLCSVGLLLDPDIHGTTPDCTPEEEFAQFIDRYPTIKSHLNGAAPVRNWVRANRLQYSATKSVGDRFSLIGHAAGFIDPLFSKGLYTSLASILSFGRTFLQARQEKDFTRERFLEVERVTLDYVQSNDRLVASAIKSFSHPALWRQYSVIWILGAYLELIRLTTWRQSLQKKNLPLEERWSYEMPKLNLVGGGYGAFYELAAMADQLIDNLDSHDEIAVERTAKELQALILDAPFVPYSHKDISRGKRHLPKNKFTPRLIFRKGGLLGEKKYRNHFFGDTNPVELATFMLKDRMHYSRLAIEGRRKMAYRKAI